MNACAAEPRAVERSRTQGVLLYKRGAHVCSATCRSPKPRSNGMGTAGERTIVAKLSAVRMQRAADRESCMPWWITPVAAAAAFAGVSIQMLLTFLWTIAKSSMH